jgi:PhoH-like ATPase
VPLENGGRLRVVLDGDFLHATFDRSTPAKPGGMLKTTVDNSLLAVARRLQAEEPEVPVVLVTKDTNLRVKADAMDLTAEDFEAGRVRLSEIGAGQAEMKVSPEEMERFQADGFLPIPEGPFHANTYVHLQDNAGGRGSALARVNGREKTIQKLKLSRDDVFGLRPRNREQYYALDALMDDEIMLVSLMGKAGTGKTLLALAAGLARRATRASTQDAGQPRSSRWGATSATCPAASRRSSTPGCSRSTTTSSSCSRRTRRRSSPPPSRS